MEGKQKKPIVTIVIVTLNVLVFLFTDLIFAPQKEELVYRIANNPIMVLEGKEYYRLFTSIFFHFDVEHIMYNMLMLVYIGFLLEKTYGGVRYVILYFFSGILADLASILYNMYWTKEYFVFSAGASGAIFGLLGAIAADAVICGKHSGSTLRRRDIPVLLIFTVAVGFFETGVDHAAHIGGFLTGTILGGIFAFLRLRRILIKERQKEM